MLPPGPADSSGSLAERAYEAIRARIVALELAPGAPLDERGLIDELAIGRTPIREALRRLAQEGLVEVFPRRGMVVTTVDQRDLAQLAEVRAVLEPAAARLAARRADAAERSGFDALVRELREPGARTGRALVAIDERIHRSLYRAAHNPFLAATLEAYFVHALRIWYLALDRASGLERAVSGHAALLEAVRDGKAARAASLMREHVDDFERSMREALAEAPAPTAAP